MSEIHSPSFGRPPVVERVLGVQFDTLPGFKNAHLGAFWKEMGSEWPLVDDMPRLADERERFGDDRLWTELGRLNLQLSDVASSRIRIHNGNRNRMVQLQNGRLHYNWVKRNTSVEDRDYPNYSRIRQEFDAMFERLRQFANVEKLGDLKPNQWEVTYVNHIARGTVWNDPSDWLPLFNSAMAAPSRLSSNLSLETLNGNWSYEIHPKRGRLHINIHHGITERNAPEQETLVVQLTARGPVMNGSTNNFEGVAVGLDLGHTAIVEAFAELTSTQAHTLWERKQ